MHAGNTWEMRPTECECDCDVKATSTLVNPGPVEWKCMIPCIVPQSLSMIVYLSFMHIHAYSVMYVQNN